MSLKGAIDTHVDISQAKENVAEAIKFAGTAGMQALVLKDDHGSTVDLASRLRTASSGIEVRGGLVLNRNAGGFSVDAVDGALNAGAAVIWMPTIGAENDRSFRGLSTGGLRATDEREEVLPEVAEIIRRVAKAGAILATGHLSAAESKAVVEFAKREGVRAVLVNHPEMNLISMPVAMQIELCGPGIFFERCYGLDSDGKIVDNIRAVGVGSTILATGSAPPGSVGELNAFAEFLLGQGFTESEIEQMLVKHPAAALGLN